ncbi:hypothetical protein FG386_002565 [Cryptosporidium ryanae]|uniref:uncharacterized protein n=1 Tax=Cryptosporidium ryanae TaxID=515981 RepID=UPI003519F3A7|nr:hypothetical protein FG386_002565 [Cryptosporidium ryanae]
MSKKTKRLSSGIERIKKVRCLKKKKNVVSISKSTASTNPDRKAEKKDGFYRTKSTINRLNMYREKGVLSKNDKPSGTVVRVEPDRRWFGNTRVITQDKMEIFREEMSKANSDPYSVILKRQKLPISIISHASNNAKSSDSSMKLLTVEPYNKTFGEQQRRKRPKIVSQYDTLNDFIGNVEKSQKDYNCNINYRIDEDFGAKCSDPENSGFQGFDLLNDDSVLRKGTSRRIWQELYKVIDSSDIIIHVLDARDPEGTRCRYIEEYISKECKQKYILFVLNKVDLIPKWVISKWIGFYGDYRPTIAFHSSITNSFGKRTLFHVLRQYASLLKDKKHVSVGFVGYPNVGKSSIINTLRGSKVCKVAPIPGETKIWQYIHLTHRIYLIDCPGIVPPESAVGHNVVLRGAVRPEKLSDPCIYIKKLLSIVRKSHIKERYDLKNSDMWSDSDEFLTIVGKRLGKILRGGEVDIVTTAKIILNDWISGKIPYFIPPKTSQINDSKTNKSEIQVLDQKIEDIEVCKEFEDEIENCIEETTSCKELSEPETTNEIEKWEDVLNQFD